MLASTATFVIGKVAVLPGEEKVEDADIRNVYRGIRRVGRHSEISMVVFYDILLSLNPAKRRAFLFTAVGSICRSNPRRPQLASRGGMDRAWARTGDSTRALLVLMNANYDGHIFEESTSVSVHESCKSSRLRYEDETCCTLMDGS